MFVAGYFASADHSNNPVPGLAQSIFSLFISRCICKECTVDHLSGALEFRCCREIAQASQKLTFDGSIERVSCITNHDDFSSMTNRSVLLQVGPLLRDKSGRGYRRRDGQTEAQDIT